ncbi:hypothetical protein VTP01DRAFT_9861 [Rhizomucor pusillus]|uniref:uncharacterized protein n=1 Tax=Rhizomucor pusillus TaxID=4840 RepID=UPI0037443009
MTSKATQEYRTAFITLIAQLSEIERRGQQLFEKIEKAVWTPYETSAMQADYERLLASLHSLQAHAKASGLLSITSTTGSQARNLATRTRETHQAVETFFQEKNRLLTNSRAAANTAR